jgi:hypothetical protein
MPVTVTDQFAGVIGNVIERAETEKMRQALGLSTQTTGTVFDRPRTLGGTPA